MVGKELAWITKHIPQQLGPDYAILECQKFSLTAPGPDDMPLDRNGKRKYSSMIIRGIGLWCTSLAPYYPNAQTAALCSLLEMENKIEPPGAISVGHA
jgi:hypothetical protein